MNATQSGQRVALVTGAAQGIGAATARVLAARGYAVAALDAQPAGGAAVAEIAAAGGAARFWQCDVTDEAAVERTVHEVRDAFARIDVLVNNAGVVLVKPLVETTWADYRHVADVNLGGTFLMCKHVVPVMRAGGGGSIVNLASVSGHVGQTDHAIYGATKGAIIAFTRALAWEVAGDGIRVNSISPGSVDTPMLRGDVARSAQRSGQPFEAVKHAREMEQAFGRWADPHEIAAAVAFLASDDASFITGTDLLVDGGWVAK
jgi:NAD(P)-dependent dehydrogenase (short-subunit alcohol dehydrogenase family)